ncbi:hypothetical protein FA15DRAFT_701244 [Coprinopsis marcescibilis]|jgi:hypothetical protein|uniref:Uncharacterized protein n=1 Tax=Coprinopsis marcescibilis TaxID=230819 RepID=A0A5C3L7R9_COPMA|nr:hypothetical protein FA15DRAFT_701244 [Coprinopsis marcescibilis]
MFIKFTTLIAALSTLTVVVQASPVNVIHDEPKQVDHDVIQVDAHNPISFNRWGGFNSLDNFDKFHGVDNFDGFQFKQTFVKKEKELVCRVQKVEIVQQRLLVLQELAKKVVTETICEVEVQTIVFEQFRAGLGGFGRDLRRHPGGHQIGFDERIVGHFPKFLNQDLSLNVDDWGFSGVDLGKNTVLVGGHNWDDSRSFKSVGVDAWQATRRALGNLWFRD